MQAAPVGAVVGLDAPRWQYVFAHWQPSGGDELSAAIPAYAALAGAFIGAFPTVSVSQRNLTTTNTGYEFVFDPLMALIIDGVSTLQPLDWGTEWQVRCCVIAGMHSHCSCYAHLSL